MQNLKSLLPHLAAFFILMAISFIYFLPSVGGKVISQYDNQRAAGMQGEMREIKKETGTFPLWTNGPFCGMPTYQIMSVTRKNLVRHFNKAFFFYKGITASEYVILLAFVSFYLLLIAFGTDWRLALIGAFAYGLCTYNIILIHAGHSTKLLAMAYAPGVLAGAVWAFRGKLLLGGGVMSFFMALEFYANHLQITYYLLLAIGVLWLFKGYQAIKSSEIQNFVKVTAILGIAVILGFSSNLSKLWTTKEYGEETIRGGSELAANAGQKGLSKDYAFGWSYGVGETFTLMFPNYMGGGTARNYEDTETYKAVGNNIIQQVMADGQSRETAKEAASQQIGSLLYWGSQSSTSGPVYYGAIVCFLFFLGAILVRGPVKWWLVTTTGLFIMLSWGKNFPALNYAMFDYFPFYDKFRTVSMILGVVQILAVLLGILGLKALFDSGRDLVKRKKAIMIATGISAGIGILLLLASFTFSFSGLNDGQFNEELVSILIDDRHSLMMNSIFRSLLFIGLAAGVLWMYLTGKLRSAYAIPALGLLMLIDIWAVDWKYIDHNNFKAKKAINTENNPTKADLAIKNDTDLYYRVFDVARGGITNNTTASIFHKSLSGYHAAKLVIYQELIEKYLFRNAFENDHVLDMLNTKYIINANRETGELVPIPRSTNLGNAWFVNEIQLAENADAELQAIATLDPSKKAVVRENYSSYLQGLELRPDSLSNASNNIRLTSYHPDKMEYSYQADTEQLAVFSDIYYPPSKGWKVFIDDQQVDGFIKANYALRALRLPAGEHKLEMRFEPRSFYVGENIALLGSLLAILFFIGGIVVNGRNTDWSTYSAVQITDPEKSKVADKKPIPTPTTRKTVRKRKKKGK